MANQVDEDIDAPWWRRVAARLQLRRVLTRDLLILAALSGLAVTQPLLDLFGRNPEIFVAQDVSRGEVLLFALLVTFLVPTVCLAIELLAFAIGDRVGRATHVVLVVILAATLGLSVANQVGLGDVASWVVAAVIGVGLAVASLRIGAVESILRYLSAALLLFLAAFLFFSRSGELVRSGDAGLAQGIRVGNPAPVVVVQLDEFPLASLLDAEGGINAERFPNFERLADQSSWFRNATSVSSNTTISVPSAVTGLVPDGPGSLPISSSHPDNLFTLLGETYQMWVEEPVTDLCPDAACGAEQEAVVELSRLERILRDASVVLGHVTLPPSVTEELPAVDQSWGGFLAGDAVEGDDGGGDDDGGDDDGGAGEARYDAGLGGWSAQGQATILEDQIDAIGASTGPMLWYSHSVLPHHPWSLAPSGLEFARPDEVDTPGMDNLFWSQEEWPVRQAFQRHLLQIGYVDTLLGELMDRLEAAGLWEDALVVVMADHGMAFEPGSPARTPTDENAAEIYSVPLFIKSPGETQGEVRDDKALLVDVLPSIVDLLDVDVDWTYDGRSLFGGEPEPDDRPVVEWDGKTSVTVDEDDVMDVVTRNLLRLPHGSDMASVAAFGANGDLVGRSLDEIDVVGPSDVEWTVDQAWRLSDWQPEDDPAVPLLWRGTVTMPDGEFAPSDILAVVNGRVAGVIGGFGIGENAPDEYTAFIAGDALEVGPNEVALLVPVEGTDRAFALTGTP